MFFEKDTGKIVNKGYVAEHGPESGEIKLNYRVFEPRPEMLQPEPGKKPGIFFHPGWANPIWGEAVRSISGSFADFSGVRATAFEVRGNPVKLKQREGAEAERKFIEANGYTDVTIVGNSQGGVRAIELADLLQEKNPEIKINGLILLASKGLGDVNRPAEPDKDISGVEPNILDKIFYKKAYEDGKAEGQNENETNFFARLLTDPGAEIMKHPIKNRAIWLRALRLNTELFADFIKQVKEAEGDVAGGIRNLRGEMTTMNQALRRIKCPVVLIHGEADLMANPNFVIRPEMGLEAARNYARTMQEPHSADTSSRNEVVSDREEFLYENILPESRGVKFLIADAHKLGHHHIAGYRNLAAASFAALERINRKQRKEGGDVDLGEYLKDRRRFTSNN